MHFPAVTLVWAFCVLRTGCFSVPTATIRSPFEQNGNSLERRDRGSMASPSRPSYVIYDSDVNSLQNSRERPQILHRPRSWHLEFNNQQQSRYPQQQPSYTSPSYPQDNYQQTPYASSSFVHDKYQPLPTVPPYASDNYQPSQQQPSYGNEKYQPQERPSYGNDKFQPQERPTYGKDKFPSQPQIPPYDKYQPQQPQPSYGQGKYPSQQKQPSYAQEYQPVYSNLIQVLDSPRKYYGPYDSKSYQDPERGFYSYPRYVPRPSEVPRYEVIYPYDNQPKSHFYGENLPDRFPTTFMPEKNFKVKDPPLSDGLRGGGDIGFHRTQTVNYFGSSHNADSGEDRRGSRREQCNYIKLNEKGFPLGNELCGRSVSDILLAPDYPTTGDLILEHRKRYRGVHQGRSLDPNVVVEEKKSESNKTSGEMKTRKRRSAQMYPSRFLDRCCDGSRVNRPYDEYGGYGSYDSGGRGYGFSSYNAYNRGNGYRPYGRTNDYGFGYGGQYEDNYRDDYGDESSSRGLTTYMSQTDRDRGHHRQNSEENDGGSSNYNFGGRRNGNNTRNGSSSSSSSQESHNQNSRHNQNSSRNSGFGNYGDSDRQFEYGSNNGNFQSTSYMRGRDGDYFGSSGSGGSRGSSSGYGSSSGDQFGNRDFGNAYGRRSGSDEYSRYPSYKK